MPDLWETVGGFIPDPVTATAGVAQLIQAALFLGILGAIVFLLFKFKLLYKFPVDIDIFQVKKGVLQLVDKDKARRVKKKDGQEYYDVKKRNFKWYPPTFEGQLDVKGGKKTKLYVQELSHNEWQIIDPASFIKADPKEYRKLEIESQVRYWKNLEDMKADQKWNKESSWKKLLELAPTIVTVAFVVLFIYFIGTYVITPVMGTFGAVSSMSADMFEQSSALLERSTQYVEMLLALNNVEYTPTWVNTTNESVIA